MQTIQTKHTLKSVIVKAATAALFLLIIMSFAGCGATSQRIKPLAVNSNGVPFTTTLIDAREAGGSITLHAPGMPQWNSLDPSGFESTSGQPSGLAFISQFGVGMANPADASFQELQMEFTDEGIPKSLMIKGFNAAISGPILAKAEQLDRIVAIVHELEETDRQTFDAFMQTIQEIAPDLFTALKAALGMP